MRSAILLDRDGTINHDEGYTFDPDTLAFTPDAPAAIRAINQAGALAIVVTNQSGIGRGYFTEAQMHAFHRRLSEALAAFGARIDAFYFCPFHPQAALEAYRHPDHPDRKPNPGMLLRAIADHALDPRRTVMIGDQPTDMAAAAAAGLAGEAYRGGSLLEPVRRALARIGATA